MARSRKIGRSSRYRSPVHENGVCDLKVVKKVLGNDVEAEDSGDGNAQKLNIGYR